MKRKTWAILVASAMVVLGYSAYGVTRAFYPLPMGHWAYHVIHPAMRLVSGHAAINVARKYSGPQASIRCLWCGGNPNISRTSLDCC